MSIIFGLGAVLLGIWGFLQWRIDFIHLFRGFLPISLIFSGIVAICAGLSSPHDKK